jgi:hypothetical protein
VSEEFPVLTGLRAGSVVAGYRLEAQVGAGGMAVVFRARDERLGRLVALKLLSPALAADPGFRRRFIAESRAAAVVDNPHIIPVFEAGEFGGVLFIAMRFVAGGDLRGVLEREGPLSAGRVAGFVSPVASALDAAHRAGLVHRDVKPANILVDAGADRPDHVYLSDFGVSKGAVTSVSLAGAGHFLGTPDYSAPEQIQGRAVDGRTDEYALACVAFQLLTGTLPFERDQGMAVLLAHLSEPPPSLEVRRPGLPDAADAVLARAMAKVPEKRYGSCRDFADALRDALGLPPYTSPGLALAPGHPPIEPGASRAGSSAPFPAVAAAAVLPNPAAVLTVDAEAGSGPSVLVRAATARPGGEAVAPESGNAPRETQSGEPSAVAPETSSALIEHTPLVTLEPEITRPGAGAVTVERETVAAAPEAGPRHLETATPEPGPGPESGPVPELITGLEPETEPETGVSPLPLGSLQEKRRPRVRRALVVGAAATILLIASGATMLAESGSGHHASASLTGTRSLATANTSLVTTAPARAAAAQPTPGATRSAHRPPASSSGRPNVQSTAPSVNTHASMTASATTSAAPRQTATPKPAPTHAAPPAYVFSASSANEYSCGDEGSLSSRTGAPVQFDFSNWTSATLEIYTIESGGVLDYYGPLSPNNDVLADTSVGNYFVIANSGGGCLAVFGVTGGGQVIVWPSRAECVSAGLCSAAISQSSARIAST